MKRIIVCALLVLLAALLLYLMTSAGTPKAGAMEDIPPTPPPGLTIHEDIDWGCRYPYLATWNGALIPDADFAVSVELCNDDNQPTGEWVMFWHSQIPPDSVPSSDVGLTFIHEHHSQYVDWSVRFPNRAARGVYYTPASADRATTWKSYHAYLNAISSNVMATCRYGPGWDCFIWTDKCVCLNEPPKP